MGRAHEVRAASMAKTAAAKTKVYSKYGKEIYMAAKSGVPDPAMNLTLKHVIEKAKAAQVPGDVIKRNIEKAKDSSAAAYLSATYEGFGPGASTLIIDCLTENTNRSYSEVRNCFSKMHCNLGSKGSVSFNYTSAGVLEYEGDEEEEVLDALVMADVDVRDVKAEDGEMRILVAPNDLYKAKDAIDELHADTKFDTLEIQMLPNETVTLSAEELESFKKLLSFLNDVDDVQDIYHNVVMNEE